MTKRIVVKIGTQLITDGKGLLNHPFIESIAAQIIQLKKQKIEVILVSSGAVGAGRGLIKLPPAMNKIVQRQVLASVGQVKLMEAYSKALEKHGYLCSQVLTCKEDFRDRHHYLNMKNCFQALLHENIVPIVNENDVISIDELMFTDNDELAGLIGAMMDVDMVLILSTVEGIFDRHPKDPGAKLLSEIDPNLEAYAEYISDEKSPLGRGGMQTKARIAVKVASLGITAHIANGHQENVILRIVQGETPGTKVLPKKRVSGVKKWIAHSKGQEKGTVKINTCAEEILTEGKEARSLLPVASLPLKALFKKGMWCTSKMRRGNRSESALPNITPIWQKNIWGKRINRPLSITIFYFLESYESSDCRRRKYGHGDLEPLKR